MNEHYFDIIDTAEKAYWLGFLAADGAITMTTASGSVQYSVELALAAKDIDHLAKLREALGAEAPIHEYIQKSYRAARVGFYSRTLVQGLASHGVGPKKSLTIVPWAGPEHLRADYWRGVFDGDGSIWHSEQRGQRGGVYVAWAISLIGNESMVAGFRDFVRSKGCRDGLLKPRRNHFFAQWGGNIAVSEICALLYGTATVALDRKYTLAREAMALRRKGGQCRHLSREDLLALYDLHGSWVRASQAVGVSHRALYLQLEKVGIRTSSRQRNELGQFAAGPYKLDAS